MSEVRSVAGTVSTKGEISRPQTFITGLAGAMSSGSRGSRAIVHDRDSLHRKLSFKGLSRAPPRQMP